MSKDLSKNPAVLRVTGEQQDLLDLISNINPEALIPSGFDSCVVGMLRRFNEDPLVALDADKCIRLLMERDGMDEDEAREFFEFSFSWVGDGTPAFIEDLITDTTEVEDRLIKMLNEAWKCLPNPFFYEELNKAISWDDAWDKLQELEQGEYPELGIVEAKKGMTVLSLLATVTDVLCGKRLAALVGDNGVIVGWTWWTPPKFENAPEDDH